MGGVFEVYVKTHFSAAHRLEGYPGDCARAHGHNWIVEAYVKCRELDQIGIGIDFRDIKQAVKEVLFNLDHFDLNELEPGVTGDSDHSSRVYTRFLELANESFSLFDSGSSPKLHEGDGGNILYRAAELKLFSMGPIPNKRDVDIGIEHDFHSKTLSINSPFPPARS